MFGVVGGMGVVGGDKNVRDDATFLCLSRAPLPVYQTQPRLSLKDMAGETLSSIHSR